MTSFFLTGEGFRDKAMSSISLLTSLPPVGVFIITSDTSIRPPTFPGEIEGDTWRVLLLDFWADSILAYLGGLILRSLGPLVTPTPSRKERKSVPPFTMFLYRDAMAFPVWAQF